MTAPVPAAPEYGTGGDHAGARRGRRAFRFCVALCVALTVVFWFAENYLRYDKNESQYRMALTHEDPSARPILRNVVRRDTQQNATPRVRYIEALASVEEEDLVLSRFEQAYKLNPNDSFLIIKYGCRLFMAGRYRDARERFREAGIQPPKNALPRYLEAAALAAGTPADEDISEAIALIARANSSGDPVLFPEPLWHPSLLKGGAWYVAQKQRLAELCLAPLFRLRTLLITRAAGAIEEGRASHWDSWLEILQTMGQRLVGSPAAPGEGAGIRQAIAGIQIQLDVVRLRQQLAQKEGADPSLFEAVIAKLQAAHAQLAGREDELASSRKTFREGYIRPLILIVEGLLLLLLFYLLGVLAARWVDKRRTTYAMEHHPALYVAVGAGAVALLIVLCGFVVLQQPQLHSERVLQLLSILWFAILGYWILLGIVYPMLRLPRPDTLAERMEMYEDAEAALRELRRLRRKAHFSLLRRTYGIVLGIFLCVVSVWVVGYRISHTLYPFQLKLLVPGYEDADREFLRQVQEQLAE